jgi:hypothetical protein
MSCGFGAVILVFLIIDHSIEIQIQSVNAEVLSTERRALSSYVTP